MNVRKAIIPIAGRGTRQLPATWAIPKAMMPVLDADGLPKPIIHLLLAEAFSAGVERVAVVVSPGQDADVLRYVRPFDDALLAAVADRPELLAVSDQLARWRDRIDCIEQPTPQGFGHSVWCARDWVGPDPVLLLLGDYVFVSNESRSCARQLVEVFERRHPDAATGMFACNAETLPRVGVMKGRPADDEPRLYRAERIVEKPALEHARRDLLTPGLPNETWLAHFGNYVFSSKLFDVLDEMVASDVRERGEIQLATAQERLRASGAIYYGLLIDGAAYDVGIPAGWLEAQRALAR
jgi:UTP--glucose-1-phosphate uridylyltransferase